MILPDSLYDDVKRVASETGRTVTDVVADALALAVDRHRRGHEREHQPLPTFRGNGLVPGIDFRSNAALRDALDRSDDAGSGR